MSTLLAENRKVRFDYELLQFFEAGLVLSGAQVKSIRAGTVGLRGAFGRVSPGGEVFLEGCQLSTTGTSGTEEGSQPSGTPPSLGLLLSKKEIREIRERLGQEGLALVVLDLHESGGRIKAGLALGRGRRAGDKRQVLKQKAVSRELREH